MSLFEAAGPGLCTSCRYCNQTKHPRGGAPYYRCLRANEDPRYKRYPRIPVLECDGYEEDSGQVAD